MMIIITNRKRYMYACETGEEITPVVETKDTEPVQPVVPEVQVDTKEEVTVDTKTNELSETNSKLTKEIETLTVELEKLKSEIINKSTESDKNTELLNSLKQESISATEKATNYEKVLEEIVTSKMESMPEGLKDLVPHGMSIVDKLSWIAKAEKTGLFNKVQVEIGKPMNPAKAKDEVDMSKLSANSLMSMAYGSRK